LSVPAFSPFNPQFSNTTYAGEFAFSMGWRSINAWEPGDLDWWIMSVSWFANPAIWVGMIALVLGRWDIGAAAGACALCLSLLVLTRFAAVVGPHPGYWIWVMSAAFVLAGSLVSSYRQLCRR
jgi:hypothetical protein